MTARSRRWAAFSVWRDGSIGRGFAGAAAGLLIGCGAMSAAAQVSGSVEDGLQNLAVQIVEQSQAADRRTIAVLPFPHADGQCSVLSTYLVDELIHNLFSIPGSTLEIVERSQLEALLSELELGEGGLLDPATTQQLGSVSGVDALAVGTITTIGDTLRVNARLVSTDTARTVSAAAVTIPRTGAIDELLDQPVTVGPTCGQRSAARGAPSRARPPAPAGGSITAGDLLFELRSVRATNDRASVHLNVTNNGERAQQIMAIEPQAVLISSAGDVFEARRISGFQYCRSNGDYCNRNYSRMYTSLLPGAPSSVVWQFNTERSLQGTTASIVFTALVRKNPDEPGSIEVLSLTLPELSIEAAQGG